MTIPSIPSESGHFLYLRFPADELRRVLNAPAVVRKPAFRQPAPEYVQFASPRVIETIEGITLGGGRWFGHIAYYDHGVVSLSEVLQSQLGRGLQHRNEGVEYGEQDLPRRSKE